MPRVHFVKKARKDNPACKAGESYFWWKFRFGGKQFSKTRPRRSQLTQSGFLSQLYEIEDALSGYAWDGDPEAFTQEMSSQLEDLKCECEDSLQNMPEHLQESSSSGELLQERIDGLDEMIQELEAIDTEIDSDLSEEKKEDRQADIAIDISNISANF